jgi:hypothetical protein
LFLLILGIIVIHDVFSKGIPDESSSPSQRLFMPTPIQLTPNYSYEDVKTFKTLSIQEAIELRTQPNVINLAIVQPDSTLQYAKDRTFAFDPALGNWEQAGRDLNVRSAGLEGTGVVIESTLLYHLNPMQPLLFSDERMYLVDLNGQLWSTTLGQAMELPISEEVIFHNYTIPTNPKLTLPVK